MSSEIRVDFSRPLGVIRPQVHGHFIEQLSRCVNGGLWDNQRNDWNPTAVSYLAELEPVLLRWPGGCFADTYHWRNGIGPRAERPTTVTSRWGWDETENNAVGTHEFLDLCETTQAEPWINGNLATGDAQEFADWVEYTCFGGETTLTRTRAAHGRAQPWTVPYWGIGNECWDCGGKFTPAEYAEAFRRVESALPRFRGQDLRLIICGPDGNKPQERAVWTREVLRRLFEWRRPRMFAVDAHWYNWGDERGTGSATAFNEAQASALIWRGLDIEVMIREQLAVIDEFDPNLPLIIGEWGTWHPEAWKDRFFQAVAMRDGLIASAQLDVFHRYPKRIAAATMTMLCNVLSAPLQVVDGVTYRTPTYWAMVQHRPHRGQTALTTAVEADPVVFPWEDGTLQTARLSTTFSIGEGTFACTVTNLNPRAPETVQIRTEGADFTVRASQLVAEGDLRVTNSPSQPDRITIRTESVSAVKSDRVTVTVPAGGILQLTGVLD